MKLKKLFDRISQEIGLTNSRQHATGIGAEEAPGQNSHNEFASGNSDGWYMPEYRGVKICDWLEDIAQLKREGKLPEALELARGCMDAMVAAAEQNPANVMDHYVQEVAIILRKMQAYPQEAQMLRSWLDRGLPPTRADLRIDLQKRLARANALWAKAEGRDASEFTAEWERLRQVEQEVKARGDSNGVRTGYSAAYQKPKKRYNTRPGQWIPSRTDLLSESFVAVDFETANRNGGASACQVALVKVQRGQITERFLTLLKPPRGFDRFDFTYLHGISKRDVKPAPIWPQVAPIISNFVGNLPVFAHNASFDASVWRDLDEFYSTRSLPQSFYCSYRTATQLMPGLMNYKLPTVVEACLPGYQLNHHRADSDAEACALIVSTLQRIAAGR